MQKGEKSEQLPESIAACSYNLIAAATENISADIIHRPHDMDIGHPPGWANPPFNYLVVCNKENWAVTKTSTERVQMHAFCNHLRFHQVTHGRADSNGFDPKV